MNYDFTSLFDYIDEAMEDKLSTIFTGLPGHIVEVNGHVVKVQPGIQRKHERTGEVVTPPPIVEVPILIYGGNDHYVECEFNPGDEGYIMFAQRNIDGWVQSGGIAEKVTNRKFDETDAFFVPGFRSYDKRPTDLKQDGIRLRNKAGDKFIHLKKDGTGHIKLDSLIVDCPNTQFNGNVTVSDTIKGKVINALSSLLASGAEVVSHIHSGVSSGPSNTGPLK